MKRFCVKCRKNVNIKNYATRCPKCRNITAQENPAYSTMNPSDYASDNSCSDNSSSSDSVSSSSGCDSGGF